MRKFLPLFAILSLSLLLIAACTSQAPPQPLPQAPAPVESAAQQPAQPPPAPSPAKPNSTASQPETPSNQNEVVVEVGFDGFSPRTVYIHSGTTVKFVNIDSRDHWPASNPYETRDDYPGFDAGRGLKPGESYSFIFEKKGSWAYHDHLSESFGGTIDVS